MIRRKLISGGGRKRNFSRSCTTFRP